MMLDRDKISFWTRIGAIALAVVFVGSFVFMGIGTNLNYSILDLFGGGAKGQQEQTSSAQDQIARAQEDLQNDPGNPKLIRRLAGLYLQNGQTNSAVEVLEQGREASPNDPVISLYLGQAYDLKAQGLTNQEERKTTYEKAGDSYAAAAEASQNEQAKEQAYLLAGQAYEQAGQKDKAIKYWNGYLKLKPEGDQADAVKERIANLLKGETTGGAPKTPSNSNP
jgi:tetratricopeptide (TPR) repeat protein